MVELARANSNCKLQTYSLAREDVNKGYEIMCSVEKRIAGRESQGAWHKDCLALNRQS
jgi:hypothetical protein